MVVHVRGGRVADVEPVDLRRRALRPRRARRRRDRAISPSCGPGWPTRPATGWAQPTAARSCCGASSWAGASSTSTSAAQDRSTTCSIALREDFADDDPFCWWDSHRGPVATGRRSRRGPGRIGLRRRSDRARRRARRQPGDRRQRPRRARGRALRRAPRTVADPAGIGATAGAQRADPPASSSTGPLSSPSASSRATGAEGGRATVRISGFHVDGFGALADLGIEDLSPGLVIVQRTERGRQVDLARLFHHDAFRLPARRDNPRFRAPVRGGRHGGRLVLAEDDSLAAGREHGGSSDTRPPARSSASGDPTGDRRPKTSCEGRSAGPTRRCSEPCSPST